MKRFFSPFTLILILVLGYISISSGWFSNPLNRLMSILYLLPGILIALSFHEYGHAAAAYRLGDNTPKYQGRVTLNPLAHIDPIGMLCIIIIGFGWGKPVMVNPGNFSSPRRDEFLVSIAGVTINFILAIIFSMILGILVKFALPFLYTFAGGVTFRVIDRAIWINLILMIFNLIPVPPLDGFNILSAALDFKHTELYYKLYQNGMIILMLLIIFDVTDIIFRYTVYPMYNFIPGLFF